MKKLGLVLLSTLLLGACIPAFAQVPATCVVSGTVLDGGSNPVANTPVRFRVIKPTTSGGYAIAAQDLTTTTSVTGTWSLTLIQGLNAQVDIPAVGIQHDTIIPSGVLCPAAFSSLTLYSRGTLTPASILSTAGPSMGGDLTGSSPNPSVVGLRGVSLKAATPTNGQAWVYNSTEGKYVLSSVASGSAVSSVTAGTGISVTGTATAPVVNVATGGVTATQLGTGAAATNVGALGGDLTGTLPSPDIAAGAITNAEVNAGAAIAWSKISKAGAVPADIGAASATGVVTGVNAGTGVAIGGTAAVPIVGIAAGGVSPTELAAGAAAANVSTLGGDLSGTLPNPQIAAGTILNADVNASAAIAWSKIAKAGAVASDVGAEASANKGQPNGYASLDAGGKVPSGQLPATSTPSAHAATHAAAGSDPVSPASIAAANLVHSHAEADVTGLVSDLADKGSKTTANTWTTLQTFNGGISVPGGFSPGGNFTLQPTYAMRVNMAPPAAPSLTPSASGGTLTSGTYYYVIDALDGAGGETTRGVEASTPVTGPTGSVVLSWAAIPGAASYRVYRGTSAGAENTYYTTSSASYTDTGSAGTGATPPVVNTAYSVNVDGDGTSWVNGGRVGIGTVNPGAELEVNGTIVASALEGNLTGNVTGNVTGTATSISGNLTGDVTSVGMATTVASVGGQTAANVAAGSVLANAATSANTASAIVKRDVSGNFTAGTITAALSGNATTASDGLTSATGTAPLTLNLAAKALTGSVAVMTGATGGSPGAKGLVPQPLAGDDVKVLSGAGTWVANGAGSVTSVGLALPASEFTISGSPVTGTGTLTGAWANQTQAKVFASPAGSTGTPTFRALVSGDLPNPVVRDLTGNVTGNVTGTAASITGNLTGDVTSVGMTTTVAAVGGQTAANVASGAVLANAATSANTASAIVRRDGSGGFLMGALQATGVRAGNTGAPSDEIEGVATGEAALKLRDATAVTGGGLRIAQSGTVASLKTYDASDVLVGTPAEVYPDHVRAILRDKGGAVYNVKAYGAVGDDATNDTAAVQAAMDAAASAGGGIAYFPKGTYRVSSIATSNVNVSLVGANPGASKIKCTVVNGNCFASSYADTVIDSLAFSTVGTNLAGQKLLYLNGARPRVRHVNLTVWREAIYTTAAVTDGLIEDCYIAAPDNGLTAIHVVASDRTTFRDIRSEFSATVPSDTWIHLSGSGPDEVNGNVFENIRTYGGGFTIDTSTVVNNRFVGGIYDELITIANGVNTQMVGVTSTERVLISGGTPGAFNVGIIGGRYEGLSTHAIEITGAVVVAINGASIGNAANSGIKLGAGAAGSTAIVGNTFQLCADYDIEAAAGAVGVSVEGNTTDGNGLGHTSGVVPTIASAASISPPNKVTRVSGVAAIATIGAVFMDSPITLIPTGAWTTTTAGNIATAVAATVNVPITFFFNDADAKWYPAPTLPSATASVTGGIQLNTDLGGTATAPTVANVGGKTAAQIGTSVDATLAAASASTASTIVKRHGSGGSSFKWVGVDADANGASVVTGTWTEAITLNTGGTTTDSTADLPADSIIDSVACRVTTNITTAANWSAGTSSSSTRFINASTALTAGSTVVGLQQWQGSVTTDVAGPVQSSTAKLRITTNATPGAGAMRCTVFYRTFTAPTS